MPWNSCPRLPGTAAHDHWNTHTTVPRRVANFPDLPAMNETYSGVELSSWQGLAAPAGMPAPILAKLPQYNQAFLRDPETAERYRRLSLEMPASMDPAGFAGFT